MKDMKPYQKQVEPAHRDWPGVFAVILLLAMAVGGWVSVAALAYGKESTQAPVEPSAGRSAGSNVLTEIGTVVTFAPQVGLNLNGTDIDVGRLARDYGLPPTCTALVGTDASGEATNSTWAPCRIQFGREWAASAFCDFTELYTSKTYRVRAASSYVMTPTAVEPGRWHYECWSQK